MNKLTASVELTIPFFDVDAMHITWHGHYIKYFEIARCALLDKIQFNYDAMAASGFDWPIVDLRVKYIKPTLFNQNIIVTAELVEYENRLKLHYLIQDKLSLQKLTEGYSIQVAVDKLTQTMCFVTPNVLIEKIRGYQC